MPFSAYLSHLTDAYENRVRAAFLIHGALRLALAHILRGERFGIARKRAIRGTVVSGGPLLQACFYALSDNISFALKTTEHPKFARKACCCAWRVDFPRLGSGILYPSHNMPSSRRYQTFAAQIFTKGVLSRWRGGGFPPSVWGTFFRFNRISYESDSP